MNIVRNWHRQQKTHVYIFSCKDCVQMISLKTNLHCHKNSQAFTHKNITHATLSWHITKIFKMFVMHTHIPWQVIEIELNVFFFIATYRPVAAAPLPSCSAQWYGTGKKTARAKLYDAQSASRNLFESGSIGQKHQTHIGYHVSIQNDIISYHLNFVDFLLRVMRLLNINWYKD